MLNRLPQHPTNYDAARRICEAIIGIEPDVLHELLLVCDDDKSLVSTTLLLDLVPSLVNAHKPGFGTPLGTAAEGHATRTVALFLERGADVDAAASAWWAAAPRSTPLHRAIPLASEPRSSPFERILETVNLLVRAGANVNARDGEGATPLDRATARELRDALRAHGATTGALLNEAAG